MKSHKEEIKNNVYMETSCKKDNENSALIESSDFAIKAYAVRHSDENIRKNSSSGALFPAAAKFFINQGGYVCGCVLENLHPTHIVTNQWIDVLRMQDSKYVQSDMKDCFTEIERLLKQGEKLLFTGTSCQVAGLKSFLEFKHVNQENLLCIDFFCHGVPSPGIWHDYVDFYSRKKKKKITDFRFRSKKYGWGRASKGSNYLSTAKTVNRTGTRSDNFSAVSRLWNRIFSSDFCTRRYCHLCPYAKIDKPSDITMGDFWGIELAIPDFDDGRGTSVAIVHTKKGEYLINESKELITKEVLVDFAVKKQANAFNPSKPAKNRDAFWSDYKEHGFDFVMRKYFDYNKMYCLKNFVKRTLFELNLRNLS